MSRSGNFSRVAKYVDDSTGNITFEGDSYINFSYNSNNDISVKVNTGATLFNTYTSFDDFPSAPVNGQLAYLSSYDVLYVYDTDEWKIITYDNNNLPPSFSSNTGNVVYSPNTSDTLTIAATDSNNILYRYDITSDPSNIIQSISNDSSQFSIITSDAIGTATLKVYAEDNAGSDVFTQTIINYQASPLHPVTMDGFSENDSIGTIWDTNIANAELEALDLNRLTGQLIVTEGPSRPPRIRIVDIDNINNPTVLYNQLITSTASAAIWDVAWNQTATQFAFTANFDASFTVNKTSIHVYDWDKATSTATVAYVISSSDLSGLSDTNSLASIAFWKGKFHVANYNTSVLLSLNATAPYLNASISINDTALRGLTVDSANASYMAYYSNDEFGAFGWNTGTDQPYFAINNPNPVGTYGNNGLIQYGNYILHVGKSYVSWAKETSVTYGSFTDTGAYKFASNSNSGSGGVIAIDSDGILWILAINPSSARIYVGQLNIGDNEGQNAGTDNNIVWANTLEEYNTYPSFPQIENFNFGQRAFWWKRHLFISSGRTNKGFYVFS